MYFITTVRTIETDVDDQRCVGYYKHYNAAHTKVMDNSCDIFEDGYYRYAVIIKVSQGLYPDKDEIQWFECDEHGGITTIERPDFLDRWYPYTIG